MGGTEFTGEQQLALPDHVDQLDPVSVTAADQKDLNPSIGRTNRVMAR